MTRHAELVKGTVGALVAVALTAGLLAAMGVDLEASYSPGGGAAQVRLPRRGVVLGESGAAWEPALARRERKGVVLVSSGADLLPAATILDCEAPQPSAQLACDTECAQRKDSTM